MEDIREDLQTLQDPKGWPRWPFLPVIERNEDPWKRRCGVVVEGLTTVFLVNVWSLKTGLVKDILAPYEKIDYSSFEELVKVWKVD